MGIPLPIPSVFFLCAFRYCNQSNIEKYFGSRQRSVTGKQILNNLSIIAAHCFYFNVRILIILAIITFFSSSISLIVPFIMPFIVPFITPLSTCQSQFNSKSKIHPGNTKTENLLFAFLGTALLLGTLLPIPLISDL